MRLGGIVLSNSLRRRKYLPSKWLPDLGIVYSKNSGVSWKRLDDFGLEYRYIAKYLKGELTKEKMIERLKKEIEHYAKRQMTWFKRDKRICWIKNYLEAEKLIRRFLGK